MSYILYDSQSWEIEEKQMYAGQPNFYKSHGEMGQFPVTVCTDKLEEAITFNYITQCRTLIKNKKLAGFLIMKLDVATQLLIQYNNARKKRTEQYRITKEELDILKQFEEAGKK